MRMFFILSTVNSNIEVYMNRDSDLKCTATWLQNKDTEERWCS